MFEDPVFFESSIVERQDNGCVLIALFDGAPQACVTLLECRVETARALSAAIGSALNLPA